MTIYADLEQETRRLKCKDCDKLLTVAIIDGDYQLVCPRNRNHKNFVPQDDPVLKRFDAMANAGIAPREVIEKEKQAYLEQEQNKYIRRNLMAELGEYKTTALAKYQGVTSLSRTQAREIVDTVFPGAPEVEKIKAVMICAQYGLNPLDKHLFLIPFEGKGGKTWATVLGIKATRLIASRKGGYHFHDGPRIMQMREQEEIRGEADEDNWWAICVVQDNKGNRAPGYGFWSKKKDPYGTDKGNTPQNMAFIRAERQALDRLFPGEMPSGLDVMDDAFEGNVQVRQVDQTTGEITEAPAKPHGASGTSQAMPNLYLPTMEEMRDKLKEHGIDTPGKLRENLKGFNYKSRDLASLEANVVERQLLWNLLVNMRIAKAEEEFESATSEPIEKDEADAEQAGLI